jgi:hypothetical protein
VTNGQAYAMKHMRLMGDAEAIADCMTEVTTLKKLREVPSVVTLRSPPSPIPRFDSGSLTEPVRAVGLGVGRMLDPGAGPARSCPRVSVCWNKYNNNNKNVIYNKNNNQIITTDYSGIRSQLLKSDENIGSGGLRMTPLKMTPEYALHLRSTLPHKNYQKIRTYHWHRQQGRLRRR